MVGILSVAVVPFAFMDRVNRYTILPQLAIALLGVLVGYLGWLLYGVRQSNSRAIPLALGFLLVELLSVASAHSPGQSLVPVLTDFVYVSLLVIVATGLTRSQIERTVGAASLVCGIVSLIGLLQYFDIGREWVPTSGLPSGTLGHRNFAAAYAVVMIPFVLWELRQATNRWLCLLWAFCSSLCLAFIIATRSRGGWLSLVAAMVVVGLLAGLQKSDIRMPVGLRRFKALILAVGAVGVVLISAVPANIGKGAGEAMWHGKSSVGQAVSSISVSGGDKGRFILWDTTLEMIRNQPIIGVGPGNWRIYYPVYADGELIDGKEAPFRAHNDLLTIWSESGSAALGLYIAMLFFVFRSALRQVSGRNRHLILAIVASAAAYLTNGLFSFPREFVAASAPLWFGMGLLTGMGDEVPRRHQAKWLPALGVCISLLGIWATTRLIDLDTKLVTARIASARGDWSGVLTSLESVPRSSSFDEQAHLLRALAYQKTGDPDSSLQAFRAGLEIHPHHPGLWLGIGDAQRALGRYEEADESYHKALSYDPQNGDALNNLGVMYASKGDMEGAINFLERALSDLGRPLEVFSNLSAAYRRSGMLDRALEVAKTGEAIRWAPDIAQTREAIRSGPDILNAIGNAYSGLGDQKNAMDAFKAGLLEDPDHVQLHFNLARAYESLDRVDHAIRQYKEVLKRLGDRFVSRKTSIENRIRLLRTEADSTQ